MVSFESASYCTLRAFLVQYLYFVKITSYRYLKCNVPPEEKFPRNFVCLPSHILKCGNDSDKDLITSIPTNNSGQQQKRKTSTSSCMHFFHYLRLGLFSLTPLSIASCLTTSKFTTQLHTYFSHKMKTMI